MLQRVAIYARGSTAEESCERQIVKLLEYATRANFTMVGVFKEKASSAIMIGSSGRK
ncbi:MAG: recombinase family protein [Cyanobacteria bacterium SZAS LIN-3]|nr:recombinase family protein [Cyanobacteria bacterium SZAS LIN-3]